MAAEIEYRMKKMGADDRAFDVVVASGTNSSMPHAAATSKKIEVHDIVKIDYGVVVNGYCSDITRTVIMGDVSKEVVDIYETVREAQELALCSIRRDISCNELDSIARSFINEKGYGERFGHGLGHGVGLDIHEDPFIAPSNDQLLEISMVFTVEPGIYVPGLGGIRIEDMVVLEKDGVEVLTKTNKDLIII
jgi:Xaa-Pro aminopeptidase